MWPTPTAQDNNQVSGNPDHPKRGTTLGGAVRQWPTPAASQAGEGQFIHGLVTKDGKPAQPGERAYHPETGKHSQITLNRAVKLWPTPTARDHKGGYQGGRIRNGKISKDTLDVAVQHTDNQSQSAGQLNPTWVEWLMGLPLGWTDLGCWGTE